MSSHVRLRLAIPARSIRRRVTSSNVVPFTTSSRNRASDPFKDLADSIIPSKTPRPEATPVASRPPSEASDARNPALHGYPAPDGTMTSSTATSDSATNESPSETGNQNNRTSRTSPNTSAEAQQASAQTSQASASRYPRASQSATSELAQKLESSMRNSPSSSRTLSPGSGPRASNSRVASRPTNAALSAAGVGNTRESVVFNRRVEAQQPRTWQPGDVYSPHDLSPAEAMKNSRAGGTSARNPQAKRPPTRSTGVTDVFDAMCIDPVREYKNFSMMGEFVSDMGRIKPRRATGLRLVNQRRLARGVRRAIGLGLIPSVHRHPELFDARMEQMGRKTTREQSRGL